MTWAQSFLATLLDARLEDGGPRLFATKIDDKTGAAGPVRDPALIRNRFMKGIGTARAGALDGYADLSVMAGHSRPKDGVASLAYVPAIHVSSFSCCQQDVDARHKAGHDRFPRYYSN